MTKRLLAALWVLCALFSSAYAAEAPAVSAASAVLLDADSGRVLFAKNETEPRPIASITKLMTALVASEYIDDWDKTVKIKAEWTGIEGTSLYLKAGEELSLKTLLYGLLLQSGNDAAVALAGCCAGDTETFVAWMNRRAADLGMENTKFADPNGLSDEGHYSSALDMARLAAACLKDPQVSEAAATRTINLDARSFANHNKLLWQYPGCIGMKTGYTKKAGRTLVSAAEREGQTLICVTLSDRDDWADHTALLNYGFETFPSRTLVAEGELVSRVPVEGSLLRMVPVACRKTVTYPLSEEETYTVETDLPGRVDAPVTAGEIAGGIRFCVDGEQVAESYLVWAGGAGDEVKKEKAGFFQTMADVWQESLSPWTYSGGA